MARKQSRDKEAMKRAASIIVNGGSIESGLLAAGYSANTAKLGRRSVPDELWQQIAEKSKEFGKLGKQFDPETVEAIIEGRLAFNTIAGKSDGESSAKLWGSMKKHQLFQADSMTGVIVLQAPNLAPAGKTLLAADSRDLLPSPILDVETED